MMLGRSGSGECEDQLGFSYSENIEESPLKRDKRSNEDPTVPAGGTMSHHKIYEFTYNENNAKSVISSTDRKKPNS